MSLLIKLDRKMAQHEKLYIKNLSFSGQYIHFSEEEENKRYIFKNVIKYHLEIK